MVRREGCVAENCNNGDRHPTSKLRVAKGWEIDATFQIVLDPFYQLFAVCTSIRKRKQVKTVHLTFTLMSCETKISYLKFLRALVSPVEPFGTFCLLAVLILSQACGEPPQLCFLMSVFVDAASISPKLFVGKSKVWVS